MFRLFLKAIIRHNHKNVTETSTFYSEQCQLKRRLRPQSHRHSYNFPLFGETELKVKYSLYIETVYSNNAVFLCSNHNVINT